MSSDDGRLTIRVFHRMADIDPVEWESLSAGRPFQSYRWYEYGERVMSDCPPAYILCYCGKELAGRASLWLIRNEPLPLAPGVGRAIIQSALTRWPLMICRSPLSYSSGLVFAERVGKRELLSAICDAAFVEARRQRASILLFDFLSDSEAKEWPSPFLKLSVPDPGTVLENRWAGMDEYFASDKERRQHYKRVKRKAEQIGIKIGQHASAYRGAEALELVREVDRAHGTPLNPWTERMLEHMEMVNGTFLAAEVASRLAGCGLLLEDNGAQITTQLGLAKDMPYVYLTLLYESLKIAMEHKMRLLRWGSGAYEIKKRLGFALESNNNSAFVFINPMIRFVMRKFVSSQ